MERIPWRSQAMLKLLAKRLRSTASLWSASASFRGEWDSTVGQVAEVLNAMTRLPLPKRRKAIASMAKVARVALADDKRHRLKPRTEAVVALRENIAGLLAVRPPRRPRAEPLPRGARRFEPPSRGQMIGEIVHASLRHEWTTTLSRLVREEHRRELIDAFDHYLDEHKVSTDPKLVGSHAEALALITLRVIGLPNHRAAFNFESSAAMRAANHK